MQNSHTTTNIIKELPKAEVYLVGGPSGAGKSAFAEAFSKVNPVVIIPLDDYFIDEEMVRFSFSSQYGRARQWDHPSSVDLELALRNVIQLLGKKPTQLPIFSFAENRRIGYRGCRGAGKTAVLVEGLHALLLQSDLKAEHRNVYSIFVNADVSTRRKRVSKRDSKDRKRPLSDFERRFYFMRIAERRWILPQRRKADLLLDTSDGLFRIEYSKAGSKEFDLLRD